MSLENRFLKRHALWKGVGIFLGAALAILLYANQDSSITTNGKFQVSNGSGSPSWNPQPWEPATAVGPNWVHAYYDYNTTAGAQTYTAAWNSGTNTWTRSTNRIVGAGPVSVYDAYLAYDPYESQYLMVAAGSGNVYFGTSTDGVCWNKDQNNNCQPLTKIFDGQDPSLNHNGEFDFPSIAVDDSNPRRLIVGAVLYQTGGSTSQCIGYYVKTFTDGGTMWSSFTEVAASSVYSGNNFPTQSGTSGDSARWGINGRVVGAGTHFYVFLPTLATGQQFQPEQIYYFYENSGTWTLESRVYDLSNNPPANNSPCIAAIDSHSCNPATNGYIYYAPLIDASGNDSGTWGVTFQSKTGGGGQSNNVYLCYGSGTSSSGCYAINSWAVDQFMNGVSVDHLGGIWVSYLGFAGSNYQLNLYHQTLYLPAGRVCVNSSPPEAFCGTTGYTNVNPTAWKVDNTSDRCNVTCFAMGDFARIGSNGGSPSNASLGISAPFVDFASSISQLFQIFYADPPGPQAAGAFTPHSIYYPPGTSYTGPSVPNSPDRVGIAPELRRRPPGLNGHPVNPGN